ncbi:unnamed protein product [Alternaria alternata]
MAYLARSKVFEIEKAFDTDYPVDHVPGARKTNHENDTRQVDVSNITDMNHWDLDTHGFCILKAQTSPQCNETFMDREAVWRPLKGPNNDWPLALCDWTTIDQENDIRLNDGLRKDRIDENSLLHFNQSHKWYYIKNQMPSDLIVFRQADSTNKLASK